MLRPVRRKRRLLPLAVLAVLVAVNASLIVLLVQSQQQITVEPASQLTFDSPSPTSPPATTPAPEESASVSPTLPPTSTPSVDQKMAQPTRLLVVTSATEAWRATVGDCNTPGQVERSANGGKSWRRAVEPTLGPIVRLEVEANGDIYTVGGDGPDCSIRYIAYSTAGAVTGQTATPQSIWSRDPKNPDQIHGPTSASATPCNRRHVLGLASLDRSKALVVCTDGSVMVTSNSGRSWKRADKLVGTMAVGAGGGRFWVAGEATKCDGVAVRSFSLAAGKLSRGGSQCAADLPLTPGRVAIDASDTAIWLWTGNKVQVSTDRGRTWKSR